jgi:cobalt/nickel transport system permease protein
MHNEEFAYGDSLLHRLDPRVKIVFAAAFAVLITTSDRFAPVIFGLCGSVVLLAIARLDLSLVLKRLLVVNLFIFFLWLFLPFTFSGEALFRVGSLIGTVEGVRFALLITFKCNAIVIAMLALLSTTTLVRLGHALSHLFVPDKLVHIFFFTVRYFFVIHEEYLRLKAAMKVRSFRPRTNFHTYRSYANMVGMLLVRSFDRSERILAAMKCRGFKNRLYVLDHFAIAQRDFLFATIFAAFLVIAGLLQWTQIIAR